MAKHTPGPWEVRLDDYEKVEANDGEGVAVMSGRYRGTAERAANARLIASAPDLLAALRFMTEGYAQYIEYAESMCAIGRGMSHPVVGNGVTHETVLRLARAAIAKAEKGA